MKGKVFQLTLIVFFIYSVFSYFILPVIEQSSKATKQLNISVNNFLNYSITDRTDYNSLLFLNLSNLTEPEKTSGEYYCLRNKPKFTQDEYRYYFNFKNYGVCEVENEVNIQVVNDTLTAVCGKSITPKFFFDPGEPEYIHNRRIPVKWSFYNRKIGNSQFVLINCEYNSIYTRVFLKYKQEAANKAQSIRNSIDPNSKPLTVAIFVIDSLSDLIAENNLKETWQFLNNDLNAQHFKYVKSFQGTTKDNMIPALYGMHLEDQKKLIQGGNLKIIPTYPIFKEAQKNHAIWSYFRNLGFITLFGYDSAYEFLAESLGPEILTDHKFANFYKLTHYVYRFTDVSENQRCAGDQGGHKPMLDYTMSFYKTYKGLLKFGYTHISSAHEDTGNIKTVDKDLVEFFKEFNKTYSENNEEFVIFFMGDHGRMNNLLRFDNRGYLDSLNPMMFVIASEGFKNYNILKENTERLIGRFDLHLTFKDLANLPYGGLSDFEYRELKNSYAANDVVSLFVEEIKANRTCEDIGSSAQKCACDQFKQINLTQELYKNIVEGTIKTINAHIYSESHNIPNCLNPTLTRLLSADHYEIRDFNNGLESIYNLTYEVQYKNTIQAEVYFWLDKKDAFLDKFMIDTKKPMKKFNPGGLNGNLLLKSITLKSPCKDQNCICQDNK